MKNSTSSILILCLINLASCATQQPIGTGYTPQQASKPNQSVRHDYLTSSDLKRVRNPEFVKTYHVGRIPSHNGQLMHEAHRVYKLEKSPRWNLLRNNPSRASTGPVRALRDSAFRPLPPSKQLQAEKLRQRELTEALETTRDQTAQQLQAMKAKLAEQNNNAALISRLSNEIKREHQARITLENQLKATQPATSNDNTGPSTNRLREWGDEQP